jgi:hypothetical protein
MSEMHRTEVRAVGGNKATFKIYAIHPDARLFPATRDFLLQLVVTAWHDMRLGYDWAFTGLDESPEEVKARATGHPLAEEFARLDTMIFGEEREVTAEDLEPMDLRGYGHNPPKEAWERREKARAALEKREGGRIVAYGSRREGEGARTVYRITLAPDTEAFADLAEKIVRDVSPGPRRQYKSRSKATGSYAHSETTFTVSDPDYLSHLKAGIAFETANYPFRED